MQSGDRDKMAESIHAEGQRVIIRNPCAVAQKQTAQQPGLPFGQCRRNRVLAEARNALRQIPRAAGGRVETLKTDHIAAFVLGGERGDKAAVGRKRALPVGIAAVERHMRFNAVSGDKRRFTQRQIAEGAEAAVQVTVRLDPKLRALSVLVDRSILQNRCADDCTAAIQLADWLRKIHVVKRQLHERKGCGAQHGKDGKRPTVPDGECRADQQHSERRKAQKRCRDKPEPHRDEQRHGIRGHKVQQRSFEHGLSPVSPAAAGRFFTYQYTISRQDKQVRLPPQRQEPQRFTCSKR